MAREMASKLLFSLFLVCLLSPVLVLSQSNDDLASDYPFNVTLVTGNYWLFWNFNKTTQNISFAVRVKTTGWIGFGLSPTGQMPGSDVVIGWIGTDGTKYFHDRFASIRSTPAIDPVQNWFLTDAQENNGYTTLKFYRNFTTCDNNDLDILFQTSHVIYSWNNNKPTGTTPQSFELQRHTSQGSTSVNLLGGLPDPPNIPNNAQTFTIATDRITIPKDDTTYWCKAIKLPSVVRQNVKHIVKFSPSITKGNEAFVHHMLVHVCNGLNETEDLGQGGPCRGGVSKRVSSCLSQLLIGGWAVGGSEFVYPENVAFSFGGPNESQYLLLQTHYNNLNLVSGINDSSGMSFTYIDQKREHDAGIMFLGHHVTFSMIIPPNANNFTITGVCTASCSDQLFPPGGIHIIANSLHTHLAGIGLTFRRSRTTSCPSVGTTTKSRYEEIKPVQTNLYYDFNFQQFTHLPNEITLLPGDTLTLECYYRTVGRTGVTLGGESTQQEMCLTFPIYYPRLDNSFCLSRPTFERLDEFIEQQVPKEHQAAFEGVTPYSSQSTIENAFNLLEWTNEQIDAYETLIYRDGNQTSDCAHKSYKEMTPSICCPYQPPNNCDNNNNVPVSCCQQTCPLRDRGLTPGSAASSVFISITVTIVLMLLSAFVVY